MPNRGHRPTAAWRWGVGAVVALWMGSTARLEAADYLVWKTDQKRVDAGVESWRLPKVLEAISAATGWQIYVEPDTEYAVTARFEGLAPPDALRRLLGDLNFALLPQTNGPAKLFVYRKSLDHATQLVQVGKGSAKRSRPSKIIGKELILTLKRGSKTDVAALSTRLHGRVVGRLDAFNAFRLEFDDDTAAREARAALEREGDVASIENNSTIAAPGVLEPLEMSSPGGLPIAPNVSPSTDQVVVGLIDTAVQMQGTMFKDFLQPGVSLFGDYQPPADQMTHGTAMAETILDGVARALQDDGAGSGKVSVSILPIDVYGANADTTAFDVGRGLYEALSRHANIINLSLAGSSDSSLVKGLIEDARSHGVLFVAAAGNEPVTTPTYPAADPGVLAATAGDARGGIASYANRGPFVDVIAPGVNVVHYQDAAWFGTGTSFATTWVSGWAAGFMASAGHHSSPATQAATLERWRLVR